MAWNLSSGLQEQLLAGQASMAETVAATTISLTSFEIDDTGANFGVFGVGDWVTVTSTSNANVVAKVLAQTTTKLTFAASSFTVEASGSIIVVQKILGNSFLEIMQNGVLDLFNGAQPGNADSDEGSGSLLTRITVSEGAFVSAVSENGLNLGQYASNVLRRGLDPNTGNTEIWSGLGLIAGDATWGRWYANTVVTGSSTSAVRCDGAVTVSSGGDIVMSAGRAIQVDVPALVTAINITASGV